MHAIGIPCLENGLYLDSMNELRCSLRISPRLTGSYALIRFLAPLAYACGSSEIWLCAFPMAWRDRGRHEQGSNGTLRLAAHGGISLWEPSILKRRRGVISLRRRV
jgi:hypothetical protein